jgi:acetyl-CoA acetyltransferase
MGIRDIVIVAGARTPMGRHLGALKDFTAIELGAIAGREAIRRSGIEPEAFHHIVFGNAMQTSADALYGARHVDLKAGLKIETPALTVNRLCGSGIQAIVSAAQMMLLGATGTRLVLTLLYELRRRNVRYGLATACIGGSQGIAMIVESMS